jgi:hypothetical protein
MFYKCDHYEAITKYCTVLSFDISSHKWLHSFQVLCFDISSHIKMVTFILDPNRLHISLFLNIKPCFAVNLNISRSEILFLILCSVSDVYFWHAIKNIQSHMCDGQGHIVHRYSILHTIIFILFLNIILWNVQFVFF